MRRTILRQRWLKDGYKFFCTVCGICGVRLCLRRSYVLQIHAAAARKKDVTKLSSDGNPGSANVFINCGIPLGLLCLFLDMFKGFLPVLLAEENYDVRRLSFAILIAAPVLGHAVAPFDRSKGGKCIATAFGVLLALIPQTKIVFLLAGLYILFSTAIRISPNRVRSTVTFALFGTFAAVMLLLKRRAPLAMGCLLVSSIVIVKHSKLFCSDECAEEGSAVSEDDGNKAKI